MTTNPTGRMLSGAETGAFSLTNPAQSHGVRTAPEPGQVDQPAQLVRAAVVVPGATVVRAEPEEVVAQLDQAVPVVLAGRGGLLSRALSPEP